MARPSHNTRSLQSALYASIVPELPGQDVVALWRRRLSRWGKLAAPPAWPRRLLARASNAMRGLSHAPPATRWALARAWLNGWSTSRRFQRKGDCCFCGQGEDSLEHACRCKVVHSASNSQLELGLVVADPLGLLLLDGRDRNRDELYRHAAYVHALYRLHNASRHREEAPPLGRMHEWIAAEIRGLGIRHPELAGPLNKRS